ncbi:hypothetical protein KMB89_gp14 [Citrobacter phage HCF1]|uniref:Uncharacterized protein n=1 Tax=Citrobacter phage HCF1 TaxID=2849700 RepID=A0ABX6D649_9CAUD|nr:hypothetical protein KMB89_gp14 [Citrobacter phage HCF1]
MFQIALAITGQESIACREQKEKAHDFLMGMTCREFMIWISEDVIKPKFGEKYFGRRLSDTASNSDYPVIVSDCGFEQEVIALSLMLTVTESRRKKHTISGMTCREFMIWISEDVIKPKFGEKYFGRRLSDTASNSDYPVIVSDCGFEQEVIALIEGGHEVKLVRMNRRGFEFDETDSRNYVYLPVCYYGENGYEEVDVDLFDGDPVYTAYELIRKFKLK